MKNKGETISIMKDFVELARKKGYSESMLMNIGIICGSSQMVEKGYSTDIAFLKAIEFVENGKTESETLFELLKLTGYE